MSDSNFRAGEMGLPSCSNTAGSAGYACTCGVYLPSGTQHLFCSMGEGWQVVAGQPYAVGQSIRFDTPDPRIAETLVRVEKALADMQRDLAPLCARIAVALEKLAVIGTR